MWWAQWMNDKKSISWFDMWPNYKNRFRRAIGKTLALLFARNTIVTHLYPTGDFWDRWVMKRL
jgi:hypothetical protein